MVISNNAFVSSSAGPLGTEFDDGLRTGPATGRAVAVYSGASSTAVPSGIQPIDFSNQWGRGALLSSLVTYNIVPRGPSGVPGQTYGNIVTPQALSARGYLNLNADNYITALSATGSGAIQLDWPRALQAIVSGAHLTAATNLTVFGYDYYNQLMQESVSLQNINIYQMKKAFYAITAVYLNGAATGDMRVGLQTSDVFGLPYVLSSTGDLLNIAFGQNSEISTNIPQPIYGVSGTLAAGGTVTVANVNVDANTRIFVSGKGTKGALFVSAVTPGTAFTVKSTVIDDETGTANYELYNPTYYTGTATLTAGTTPVATSSLYGATSIIHASHTSNNTNGNLNTGLVAGATQAFRITSSSDTDTSTTNWLVASPFMVSGTIPLTGAETIVPAPTIQANDLIMVTYSAQGFTAGNSGILSVSSATIIPGVSFTIQSSKGAGDNNTVQWTIMRTPQISGAQGIATLPGSGATSITVNNAAVTANSVILLTVNTPGGTIGTTYWVSNIAAGSFKINATIDTDTSTINWFVFPPNYFPGYSVQILGTLTLADLNTATNTTGDVRGTYAPLMSPTGTDTLHITYFARGFDNFVNQQAFGELPGGGSIQSPSTREPITADDQVGVAQYYTSNYA